MKTIAALSALVLLVGLAGPTAASEEAPSAGVWHYQKRMFIGGADVYTTLKKDGSCTQVVKGRAFGMTQWGVYGCTWSTEKEQLNIHLTESPSQPEAAGKTVSYKVLSVSPEQLHLEIEDEKHEWNQVQALPEPFAEQLESSGVGAAQQGAAPDA